LKVALSASLKAESPVPSNQLVRPLKSQVLLALLPVQTRFEPPAPPKVTRIWPETLVSKVAL
jgi:hypothetical protein